MSNTNPLLISEGLPSFESIEPAHVEEAINSVLKANRADLERLLDSESAPSWDRIVVPLEEMEDRLNRVWSPVRHLNAVANSKALRDAHNTCLPHITAYATELGQNERLYKAYKYIAAHEYAALDATQQKVIDDAPQPSRGQPERRTRFRDSQRPRWRTTRYRRKQRTARPWPG